MGVDALDHCFERRAAGKAAGAHRD
jgi:hypothetical protein